MLYSRNERNNIYFSHGLTVLTSTTLPSEYGFVLKYNILLNLDRASAGIGIPPKIYSGKFSQIFLFSYFSQLLPTSSKVILVKLKILYILMQCSKWFIFWNIYLYCKIIICFLKLFWATCFLLILQTQLVFWYFFLF